LVPENRAAWARLFVKNDPDALYICKVKAHTPWAPKTSSELRLRVGDVIGVTKYASASVWYGEVFNTAAKHEAGEFNPKLARHLTEDELDDLLIVSKHGFLECNGKKQFMVLHGGLLFRYNDMPARDKTVKQLAKAQASLPIDESTRIANVGNRKDAIRVVTGDGTQLDLVGDREVIGDWLAVLQKTIARATAQAYNVSDQRATLRVKRVQQEEQKAEAAVADAAWDEFDADLDIDFSDIDGASAAPAPAAQPASPLRLSQQRAPPVRATAPAATIAPAERRASITRLGEDLTLDSLVDGGVRMQTLFEISPPYGEFLDPASYVSDSDQREIARVTRDLTGDAVDTKLPVAFPLGVAAPPAAAAAPTPPALTRSESRTRESVMSDLRSLKLQHDVGEVDDDSFAVAKAELLEELTLIAGVASVAKAAAPRVFTPPPEDAPPEPEDEEEPEPPVPASARPWNDVSELDLLGDLDDMISEQEKSPPKPAKTTTTTTAAAARVPDWNQMDADQLFDVMLNTATLRRGEFVDDEEPREDGDTVLQFVEHRDDVGVDDDDVPPEPPAPEPPAPTVSFQLYDPYGDAREEVPPAPPAADQLGGADDDDLPEVTMTADGNVVFVDTGKPQRPVRDEWEEEEADRRRYNSESSREAEERIRKLQAERQTIVVQRLADSPSTARRPQASPSKAQTQITTLAPATLLSSSSSSSSRLVRESNDSQTAFLLHVYERRCKSGLTHKALRRQCVAALKSGQVLTELDLSRCHMNDDDLKVLAQSFDDYRVEASTVQHTKQDVNLLTLRLSDNDFRSSEQNSGNVRTILRAMRNVRHLYLCGLGLGEKDMLALNEARFLASLPLETLDLSRNPLGNAGLARLIDGFEACHTLRTLALAMCQLTDKALSRWDALFGTPPLLHLDVSHNKLGDAGVRHLMSLAAKRQRLLSFDCGENGCRPATAEVLAKWLNHNQQLQVLRCDGNDCAGFGLLLGKALAKHRSLQELNVSRCALSKQLQYVIRGAGLCGSMRRLHLSYHALPVPAQQQLIKTLNDGFSRISHLYVRDCALERRAIAAIFTYAGRANSSLEHLDIACNDFDTLKLVEHIGACVLDAPALRTLHVAATGLNSETLVPLLRGVRDNRSLKALHLDGHPKAKRWLQLAAKLVSQSKSGIEELTLRNSNVTEDDAVYFADYFRTNPSAVCSLKHLRLERNKPLEKPAVREAIASAVERARAVNRNFRMTITFVPDPETAAGIRRS
jgi:Ran GTPase-activating protein (RanGAP) involved in mRNA processing and transport